MAGTKFKTTITKKDGSTASGYIENDRGYYDDGTELSAGDSIVDAQNKVWTKGGSSGGGSGGSGSGNSGTGAPQSIDAYLAQYGVSPSGGGGGSSGSYKVTSADKPDRTGYLRSAKELAKLYDINYDMDAIRGLYDEATSAKYALLSKELEQAENDFYTNNANANATLLDTLKKATSSAIATGASRGIAGAEQLGLMMEAQQGAVDASTDIAQQRANMADEIAAEKADNIIKALEYSNQLKQNLINASTNIYSPDTQYDVGLLDFFAQMKNVEALFDQTAAQERINLASILSGDRNAQAQREHEANQGALDREAQKAINDATIKGNKEAAAITAAGYKAGAGSGYSNNYIEELLKRLQAENITTELGDRSLATTNLINQGHSPEVAQQILDTNINFLMSEKFGGSANVPQGMNASTFTNYLWNIGDMDTLAKIIAAQDTTAKSYTEKLQSAQKQVKYDKELVKNNKAGGYNNRSDVKRFNNINTLLTKAKQEHTQNGTVSDATYNELKTVVNSLAFDYAWVSDAFNKKYNSSITNMQHNGSVTMNRLNSFVKNYMK